MFYPFELEKYLESLLPERDELLTEMERVALEEIIPVVTPTVGHFLQLLIETAQAKNILEIGTAIGYSTIYLARGVQNTGGKVLTVDMNKGRLDRAEIYVQRAGLGNFVEFHLENALAFLPKLTREYDLVFVDAAKGEYPEYLDYITPKIASGGLLVVDNVLFRGWVVPDSVFDRKYDRMVNSVRDFLAKLSAYPGFKVSVLPFGDGIAIARRE